MDPPTEIPSSRPPYDGLLDGYVALLENYRKPNTVQLAMFLHQATGLNANECRLIVQKYTDGNKNIPEPYRLSQGERRFNFALYWSVLAAIAAQWYFQSLENAARTPAERLLAHHERFGAHVLIAVLLAVIAGVLYTRIRGIPGERDARNAAVDSSDFS